MDMILLVTLAFIIAILATSAWVTVSAVKNVDRIGDHPEVKSESISKSLFNFYAVVCLCAIILVRYLSLIGNDLFIGLFVLVLGALGVKLSSEIKMK